MDLSKVNVALQKIRRTLIGACQEQKQIVSVRLNELRLLVKRNVRAAKAKLLSLIQKEPKLWVSQKLLEYLNKVKRR